MEMQSAKAIAAMAPACYGAPSVFGQDSKVCQACPAFDTCMIACQDTLQKLQSTIDVSDILRRHVMARRGVSAEKADQMNTKPSFKFMPSPKNSDAKVERKAPVEKVAFEIPNDLQTVVQGMNKKPANLAIRLARKGLIATIKEELRQGRSPFASVSKPDFLSVTCDELLKGTVTRESLRKAMVSKLKWSNGSAVSHVGIVVQCFEALGIITGDDSGFVVSPETGGDNV